MTEDRFACTKEFLRVYALLIAAAERRQSGGYVEVAEIMGVPRSGHYMSQETGQMLGEISRREHECGRPMLSAVVVRAQGRRPGPGFFKLARQLGRIPEDATDEELESFWRAEQEAVYAEWSQ
jgi:hypothetical protein